MTRRRTDRAAGAAWSIAGARRRPDASLSGSAERRPEQNRGGGLRPHERRNRMIRYLSPMRLLAAAVAFCIVLFAIGWTMREDPSDKPYLKILGGGFMFNYREGEVFYGFTAVVTRPRARGSIIEAEFENPAGGEPFVVSERVSTMTDRYALRSPPIRGVEEGKPYQVAIRVYDREKEDLLWTTTRDYKSQISDEVVPDKPLVVGPVYALN